jgi:hypothetical protein
MGLLVAGCAIDPGPETFTQTRCNFLSHYLEVEAPDPEARASNRQERLDGGERSFADALRNLYSARSEAGVSDSMLFLSGGSQDGAFGVGFLDAWSRHRTEAGGQGLPDFKVVTGISTGAIFSTWAFIDQTDKPATHYRISEEGRILHSYIRPGSDLSLIKAVARKGAVGDLGPLKRLLIDNLDDGTFEEIVRQRARGRALYIGAVDIDSGKALAFDMTRMAQDYVDASPDRKAIYRNCYADAIIASSSVPMAALPTFIDNRMYIDGGARFGVFSDEIGAVVEERVAAAAADSAAPGPPFVYVLVNGDLTVPAQCGKADKALCRSRPSGGWEGRHADWRIQELARRSADILIDQVYLTSVERVRRRASDRQFGFKIDYIHADAQTFPFRLDHPRLGKGEHSCGRWSEIDEEEDHPVEFHPRYMHCLIAYGASRAAILDWAGLE